MHIEAIAKDRAYLFGFMRVTAGDDERRHVVGLASRFEFLEPFLDEGGILNSGEPGVESLLFNQFVVVASLDDAPVFQDQNLVGVANGAKPVCDDKAGAAAH